MIPRGRRVYGSVEEHESYDYPNFTFLLCIVSFGSCSAVLLFSAQMYSVTSALVPAHARGSSVSFCPCHHRVSITRVPACMMR